MRRKKNLGTPSSKRVLVEFSDGDVVDAEHADEPDFDYLAVCEAAKEFGEEPPRRDPIRRIKTTTYWRKS